MPRPLIDTETAAYAAGITERRIRQLVETGALKNHGTARRIRVDFDELATLRNL